MMLPTKNPAPQLPWNHQLQNIPRPTIALYSFASSLHPNTQAQRQSAHQILPSLQPNSVPQVMDNIRSPNSWMPFPTSLTLSLRNVTTSQGIHLGTTTWVQSSNFTWLTVNSEDIKGFIVGRQRTDNVDKQTKKWLSTQDKSHKSNCLSCHLAT